MRLHLGIFYLLIGLVIFSCSSLAAAADITVEASLSHLAFPVDQGAMLNISVEGSTDISAIELPEIEGIHFTSRGKSRQLMISGSISSSVTITYLIQAERPGIYTIPPIRVTAGGKSADTRPMSFEVTAATAGPGGTAVSPGGSQAAGDVAFIRVSKTRDHYPGEIVPVTIKAYFRQEYRTDINSLVTLVGDGVVMPQLREKPTQTQEVVNGARYNVLTWETHLSGIKEGSHPLTFSLEASLLIPQKRSSRSLFGGGGLFDESMMNDPFFDSFFGGHQRKPITVTSPQVVFHVVPLPTENQPSDFSGAIGDFDLKVSADRREIEIGEPLTLTMTISGSGNFDRVEAPIFPQTPDWKTYSPTSTFAGQTNTEGKNFEQAIVARNQTVKEIPALSFSYFDPAKKSYITKTSGPLQVSVRASTAPTPVQPAQKMAEPRQPQVASEKATGLEGLAPIHLETGQFQPEITALWQKTGFIWACGFFITALLALQVVRFRQLKRKKHPEREHLLHSKRRLSEDLQKIEQAKAAGDGFTFLALCRTAIQHQLGLHWNMTPTAISLADLSSRLQPESPLIEIFRTADQAAYGGANPSEEKMRDYLGKMQEALENLS